MGRHTRGRVRVEYPYIKSGEATIARTYEGTEARDAARLANGWNLLEQLEEMGAVADLDFLVWRLRDEGDYHAASELDIVTDVIRAALCPPAEPS